MSEDQRHNRSDLFTLQTRWLWFSSLCSIALLFSFNNCGEIQTVQANRTEVQSHFLEKVEGSSSTLEGELITGLEGLAVFDFDLAADGQSLIFEAIEDEPRDARESGLIKTFYLGSHGRLDLCDHLLAQRLYSDCRMGAISRGGTLALVTSPDPLLGTRDRDNLDDIFLVEIPSLNKSVFEGDVTANDFEGDISEVVISQDATKLVFVTKNWSSQRENHETQQAFFKAKGERKVRLVSSSRTGEPANRDVWGVSISQDGQRLLFHSDATNLLPEVSDGSEHLYIKNLLTGQLHWVDEPMMGLVARQDTHSFHGKISPDGRYVVFASEAENLVSEDRNGYVDVFLKDLKTEQIELVSRTPAGISGKGDCLRPEVSFQAKTLVMLCDPLTFGLAADLDSPELIVIDSQTKAWKMAEYPLAEVLAVPRLKLSNAGHWLIAGLRGASRIGDEAPVSLVRYTLSEKD